MQISQISSSLPWHARCRPRKLDGWLACSLADGNQNPIFDPTNCYFGKSYALAPWSTTSLPRYLCKVNARSEVDSSTWCISLKAKQWQPGKKSSKANALEYDIKATGKYSGNQPSSLPSRRARVQARANVRILYPRLHARGSKGILRNGVTPPYHGSESRSWSNERWVKK